MDARTIISSIRNWSAPVVGCIIPPTLLELLTDEDVNHRKFGSYVMANIATVAQTVADKQLTYEQVLERNRSAATVSKYRALTRALILYTSMADHGLSREAVAHIRNERSKSKTTQ